MRGVVCPCEPCPISAEAVLAHAWDAVIVLDEHGTRRFASPAIERITGYDCESYLRLSPSELCHPDDLALITGHFRACLDNADVKPIFVHRLRHRDGTLRWIEATVTNALHDPEIGGLVINMRDVTELEEARAALRRSERRLRNAFTYAGIGKAIVGMDGAWLEVNPAVSRITGYSADELCQMTFQQITHPDDLHADVELLGQLIAGVIPAYEIDKRYVRKDGSNAWVRLTCSLVRDDERNPDYLVAQIQDISEQKRLETLLRYRADHDALTGLLKRSAFVDALCDALADFAPTSPPALALIDLDSFKLVNDARGHLTGDAVLTTVGERLRSCAPESATVARWGGDEFVALFPTAEPAQSATMRIVEELRRPIAVDDGWVTIGASIGVAVAEPGDTPECLLRAADAAMYRSKRTLPVIHVSTV